MLKRIGNQKKSGKFTAFLAVLLIGFPIVIVVLWGNALIAPVADFKYIEKEIVSQVNDYRDRQGVEPLALNYTLSRTAQVRSRVIAGQCEGGSPCLFKLRDNNYPAVKSLNYELTTVVESTDAIKLVEDVIQQWFGPPGWYGTNPVLSSQFTSCGLGLSKNQNGYTFITIILAE